MEKRTKIKEVNFFKDGVSDGRAWSMHTVIDEDGWRYTSFQAEPWHTYMERGEECVIPYEEKPSTKTNPKTESNIKPHFPAWHIFTLYLLLRPLENGIRSYLFH